MKRKFDAKLWKTGNGYVVTVPSKIIKKFKLRKGEELVVVIKKEQDDTKD
jgi:antitoxin component of MazEF toxin-antitoxin module